MTSVPVDRGRHASVLVSLAASIAVGWGLWARGGTTPPWAIVLAALALAAWIGWALATRAIGGSSGTAGRLRAVGLALGLVAGGLSAVETDGLALVPMLAALAAVVGDPAVRVRIVSAAAALGVLLIVAGAAIGGFASPVTLAIALGALALTVAIAVSRRQYRSREQTAVALLEQQLATERERARSAALEERGRLARDLHDVLAHSLGALVVQLDAVDAELDAGRVERAASRVRAARGLAVDGLDEARRAVAALREPDLRIAEAVQRAVDEHVALGARAVLTVAGDPTLPVTPAVADAARRVIQEALTNARRHAAGAASAVTLDVGADIVLTIATPAGRDSGERGGGFGLAGLRERAAALGGRLDVDTGDPFVVRWSVPR